VLGLFSALLTLTSAYFPGYLVSSFFPELRKISSVFEKTVLNVTLGFGVLSFIILFFSLFGLIYKQTFWVILAVLNVLSIYSFLKENKLQRIKSLGFSGFEKLVLFLILLTGFFYVVLSFKPVVNLDALDYIVSFYKLCITSHGLHNFTRINPFFSYPQLMGMPDIFVMALSDELAINHLHIFLGFLTCCILYVTARKASNRTAGMLSALTFLTLGIFLDIAASAKIDIGTAFYAAAIFYCLTNWQREKREEWFILSVVFCAFAFDTKYICALLLLFPACMFLLDVWTNRRINIMHIKLGVFSFILYIVFASPWLIINYKFTSNPFSPMLNTIFHDSSLLPQIANDYNYFNRRVSSGYFNYLKDVFLGMPVFFLIFFVFLKRNMNTLIAFLLGVLYLLIGSFILPHFDRMFLPAFVLFSFVIGQVIYSFWSQPKISAKYFMTILYLIFALYGSYSVGNEIFRKENIAYFTGRMSKTEFLKQTLTCYPISLAANRLLPRNEKILSLGESRGFYFDQEFIQAFGYIGTSILANNSTEGIIAGMRNNHINYVLFSKEPYFAQLQPKIFNEGNFLNNDFDLVAQEGDYYLYRLK